MAWADEGIECYVCTQRKRGLKPLYRVCVSGRNRYTSSKSEYEEYTTEQKIGVLCYIAPPANDNHVSLYHPMNPANDELVPLYHLMNRENDDHLFCVSGDQKNSFELRRNWIYKGIEGYVMQHEDGSHVPLFRAYNQDLKDHLYTTSVNEVDRKGPILMKPDLENVIKKHLGMYCKKALKPYIADDDYFCTTRKVASSIIRDSTVGKRTYRSGSFDCDDFAHLLKSAFVDDIYYNRTRSKAYAFGILWGVTKGIKHAMNFVIVSQGLKDDFELFLIEPNHPRWYSPSDAYITNIELIIC